MKKLIPVFCLILLTQFDSYGQWYSKKYNVDDINSLTREELGESLKNSKEGLFCWSLVAVIGGTLFFASRNGWYEENEDPTFMQQMAEIIIGQDGMNDINIALGAGILIGGSIGSIASLGRMARIKSVINRNFPSAERMNISPVGIYNSNTKSYCPGIKFTYTF